MSRKVDRQVRTLWDKEQEELRKQNYKKYKGNIHRGDIFYFDKGPVTGVEQQGGRPGIVVSNDACNNSSQFLLVCYLTTQPKTNLPTHVPVKCEQYSICLCEQVHTLSKEKMQNYYCTATPEEMAEIDKALVLTLGIDVKNIIPDDYKKTIEDTLEALAEKKEQIDFLDAGMAAKDEELSVQNKRIKILTMDYAKAVEDKDELKKKLEEELKSKDNTIKELNDIIDTLKNRISSMTPSSIENTPEYIRACAERDVYMKLYKDSLNR